MSTTITTVQVPAELVPAIGFLAQHFSEDIYHSQAGPYEYSDQERDATQAVIDWANATAAATGCNHCELGSGSFTYHQADELAGDQRQPWSVGEAF
jgi:hypothetical protein